MPVLQTDGLLVFSTVQQNCHPLQKGGNCDSENIRVRQWREMCCGRKSFALFSAEIITFLCLTSLGNQSTTFSG